MAWNIRWNLGLTFFLHARTLWFYPGHYLPNWKCEYSVLHFRYWSSSSRQKWLCIRWNKKVSSNSYFYTILCHVLICSVLRIKETTIMIRIWSLEMLQTCCHRCAQTKVNPAFQIYNNYLNSKKKTKELLYNLKMKSSSSFLEPSNIRIWRLKK